MKKSSSTKWHKPGKVPDASWTGGGEALFDLAPDEERNLTPCVLPIEGGYRLYYSVSTHTSLYSGGIRSAFSVDGLHWQKESGYRLAAQNRERLLGPSIIQCADGSYRMYLQAASIGRNSIIVSAVSSDALEWARESGARLQLNETDLGSPCCVDFNDRLRLYYHHYEAQYPHKGVRHIRSATSGDGIHFTPEPGARINQDQPDESYSVYAPDVHPTSNGWFMFYSAWPNYHHGAIKAAESKDGIHWKSKRIILTPSRSREAIVSEPCMTSLPDEDFRLLYEAKENDGIWRIHMAKIKESSACSPSSPLDTPLFTCGNQHGEIRHRTKQPQKRILSPMINRIGFIQGRLCDLVDGKIQAFPWNDWQKEFPAAEELDITLMEWTLDHDNLYENPLMTQEGQRAIRNLCQEHNISIPNLTGDLFMQAPFYKAEGTARQKLVDDMHAVLKACQTIGTKYIVIPLVDGGRLENGAQEDVLVEELRKTIPFLADHDMGIVFESDYTPEEYLRFLNRLDRRFFGVNLDTGNSAALGFKPEEELPLYGDRVLNVHIKDRLPDGGTTVPLGTGAADIAGSISTLEAMGYKGNYILQTARSEDGDHAAAIAAYRDMTIQWLESSQEQ